MPASHLKPAFPSLAWALDQLRVSSSHKLGRHALASLPCSLPAGCGAEEAAAGPAEPRAERHQAAGEAEGPAAGGHLRGSRIMTAFEVSRRLLHADCKALGLPRARRAVAGQPGSQGAPGLLNLHPPPSQPCRPLDASPPASSQAEPADAAPSWPPRKPLVQWAAQLETYAGGSRFSPHHVGSHPPKPCLRSLEVRARLLLAEHG